MCTERLLQIINLLKDNHLLGKLNIAAIGSGSASCARGLLSDLKIDNNETRLHLYVDPSRHAYQYFGLHRGIRRTFIWKNPENYQGMNEFPKHCCLRGRMPMINAGDPWQQGAVFIFGGYSGLIWKNLKIIYENIETSPGWPRINYEQFIQGSQKIVQESKNTPSTKEINISDIKITETAKE